MTYRIVVRGKTIWIREFAKLEFDAQGHLIRGVGSLQDISELKQAAAELQRQRDQLEADVRERTLSLSIAKEAAESADRLKTIILANLNHEFRTPMSVILGMLFIIQSRLEDPEQKDLLAKVENAARSLLNILTGLLDLAASESGRLTLENKPFDVADVLDAVRDEFVDKAGKKGLRLVVRDIVYRAVSARRFMGDPSRLAQILFVLAGNAIKFSTEGTITIEGSVDADSKNTIWLVLTVCDEGIGISEKNQRDIFKPFKQIDGSSTRAYGGNGIGLALAYRLAEQMGGKLVVESTVGEGSTFTLRVPLKPATLEIQKPPAGEALAMLAQRHPKANVLVVEHDDVMRAIMTAYLEDAGFVVLDAGSATEAMRSAKSTRLDLIIIDLADTEDAGLATALAIRAMPRYAKTPILAWNFEPGDEAREGYLQAGINGQIPMPITPDDFHKIVLDWLDYGIRGD